ncbi:hypothetical protein GPECTOR_78g54 [Gonium pectorale]|uniref:Borealin N-terminal domain-containing protein n=1 Tax=Gonium pectorale TaxID=33097 RepID=A0A150G1W6_GONPE|nr:hypothetical protein GPECTOR_78g54 [Gonium pectorale]|eukprot:KXZ43866.1 hypothetical protein GPECTOR_78g54 [Gonium pectorale]
MPPRKRKAQQALAAINEDDQEKPSAVQEDVPTAAPHAAESEEQVVQHIVAECKEQVEAKATSLIEAARQRVQHLRTDAELAFIKLTKQVRQTPVADFFKLAPEQAAASSLGSVLQRLRRLQQGGEGGDPAEAEAVTMIASTLAAAGGGGALPQDTDRVQAAEPQQPLGGAGADAAAGPSTSAAHAAALMPPPAARAPLSQLNTAARAPMSHEIVYSANGSPIYLNVAAASAAPATCNAKGGAMPGIADATPAMGASFAMAAAPPQTMAFTGNTFRRATAARGRTKQATRAITVTTQDGRCFVVDDMIGLAGVPDKYREEVRRLLEADMQDLTALYKSVTTIEQANAAVAAPTTTTGTARATRRR